MCRTPQWKCAAWERKEFDVERRSRQWERLDWVESIPGSVDNSAQLCIWGITQEERIIQEIERWIQTRDKVQRWTDYWLAVGKLRAVWFVQKEVGRLNERKSWWQSAAIISWDLWCAKCEICIDCRKLDRRLQTAVHYHSRLDSDNQQFELDRVDDSICKRSALPWLQKRNQT